MVHDFFGIHNNKLDTSSFAEVVSPDEAPVFSPPHDLFLQHHKDTHIADILQTVPILKRDIDTFSKLSEELKTAKTVSDMAVCCDVVLVCCGIVAYY
eukprot:m.39481 g.39481  ORF g.39481 m.39481 type:complete len:97 (-) comp10290_c0_seq2:943-1233(-)